MRGMLLALLFFFGGLLPAAAEEKRLALVIGNSDYAVFRDLPAAANDAIDIAAALKGLGFEVIGGKDLGRAEMVRAINAFSGLVANFREGQSHPVIGRIFMLC